MRIKTINFLISIKNASEIKKECFEVDYNIRFVNILNLLYKEGFIQSYYHNILAKKLQIFLRFPFEKNMFQNLKIISLPSKKVYVNLKKICKLSTKLKFFVFSTSKGFKTSIECKKLQIGGELYFVC